MNSIRARIASFCDHYGMTRPVLLAPMAGACPPSLTVAVINGGGVGACGALLMSPADIASWADNVRQLTRGPFQINLWIPDPPPERNAVKEAAVAEFLGKWGPAVAAGASNVAPLDFASQCHAVLAAAPAVVSSIMGLFPESFVAQLKAQGIAWFATATTKQEAIAAERAGADAIVAQGMEAGGHRGCFLVESAERRQVGLFALLPAIVDAVRVPVIATGGIADARGVAAALMLGASAVQIGTGFLRAPEAQLPAQWAAALHTTAPEGTVLTRAFSGRAGRSIETAYVSDAGSPGAPVPAPYPVQRALTAAMRSDAVLHGDVQRMQAWAGQACALAQALPAAEIVRSVWSGAEALLSG